MTEQLHAITGATGALGSHIAEQLTEQGKPVRALVRRGSDRQFLSSLGCELVEGDLTDPRTAKQLVSGASHVFRQLVDESAQLGQQPWLWDHYARSKAEAEGIVGELGPRATVIRSTSFFGIRDMAFLPRLMQTIQKGGMWLFGSADNPQNVLYVGDVASMAIKAATADQAAGQTYNCCTTGDITQQELIESLCEVLQVPPVKRHLPIGLAHRVAFGFELFGKATGKKQTPKLTRHALSVFVRRTHFSTEKAERDLGWRPCVSTREGVERTAQWLKTAAPELFPAR